MKFRLHQGIFASAMLLLLYLTRAIWSAGTLLNIDNPPHLVRIWCLSMQGVAPNNWCPYINAGLPTSQYYYPVLDQLLALTLKFTSLATVSHLAVFLAIISLPIALYITGHKLKNPLLGAIAALLAVVHKGSFHFGGMEESLLVGFWHYMFSVGAFFITFVYAFEYIQHKKPKDAVIAVLASTLLAHPMTIIISIFYGVCFCVAYHKEIRGNLKPTLHLVAGALLINTYYWLPLLTKLKLFGDAPPAGIGWTDFTTYILNAMPWYMKLLAAIGVVCLFIPKTHKWLRTLTATTLLLIALNLAPNPLQKSLVGLRIGPFIAATYFLLAALAIKSFTRIKMPTHVKYGTTILLLFVIVAPQFQATQALTNSILHDEQEWYAPYKQLNAALSQLPPGRLLTEETMYNYGQNPPSFTHMQSMIPLTTKRETIAFSTATFFPRTTDLNNLDKGYLFGKKIEEWNTQELNAVFQKHNIRFALAHTPMWRQWFDVNANLIQNYGGVALYQLNITPAYFSGVTVLTDNYTPENPKAIVQGPGTLRVHVNYYPNWAADVNGKKATITPCDEQVCIAIPEGTHNVALTQKLLPLELLAYLISLVALLYSLYIFHTSKE